MPGLLSCSNNRQQPIPVPNQLEQTTLSTTCKLNALAVALFTFGVFVMLAHAQYLPAGPNVISNMGVWGRILGGLPIAVGTYITFEANCR